MKQLRCILLLCLLVIHFQSFAQPAKEKEYRILFILNGSAGMQKNWAGGDRFQAASGLITDLMDAMYRKNDDVEFGLRVYGHQYAASDRKCRDTRKEVAFSKDNLTQTYLRLKDLAPKGHGSAEEAIKEAIRTDITDTQAYVYSIIVITDSSNACQDNFCAPFDAATVAGKWYKRYVMDLSYSSAHAEYQCFDRVFDASSYESIKAAIAQIIKEYPEKKKEGSFFKDNDKPRRNRQTEYPISKPKPKPVRETPAIPVHADTVVSKQEPGREEAKPVKVSRIKIEEDLREGYLNLINISNIGHITILKNGESETTDIFPIGLDVYKLKLKEGEYSLSYYLNGFKMNKTAKVQADATTDVWMR